MPYIANRRRGQSLVENITTGRYTLNFALFYRDYVYYRYISVNIDTLNRNIDIDHIHGIIVQTLFYVAREHCAGAI
jgi:hypothetical protein